ncbi:GAF domain-containing protein [Friedmanniella luteola]|uniref:GAF domain-containing protein n=1 Tax=Friedmanniella luteola TaxID=546871 RepID=A0A1H1WN03_9ACTN|nr:GAF domain-containing protein [Friedmanniella luteola]SDS98020.1 GAF domain-containing protein [Friedmanniella luteola]
MVSPGGTAGSAGSSSPDQQAAPGWTGAVESARPLRFGEGSDSAAAFLQIRLDALGTMMRRLRATQLLDDLGVDQVALQLLRMLEATLPGVAATFVLDRPDGQQQRLSTLSDQSRHHDGLGDAGADGSASRTAGWSAIGRHDRFIASMAVQGVMFGELTLDWGATMAPPAADDRFVVEDLAAEAELLLAQGWVNDRNRRWQQWMRASRQITATLVSRRRLSLTTITEVLLALNTADLVCVVVPADGHVLRVAAASSSSQPALAASLRGTQFDNTVESLAGMALRTGRSHQQAVSQLQHPHAALIRQQAALGPYLVVPLSSDNPQGVLTLTRLDGAPAFTAEEIELTELIAHQAGLAWQLGRVDADQHRLTTLEDRDRISRTHNDETLQRLFALNTTLHTLVAETTAATTAATLRRAVSDIDELARHLRPTVKPAPSDATTLGALESILQTSLSPLAASLDFQPQLVVDTTQPATIPNSLIPVVISVVYDIAHQAASNIEVDALECQISIVDGWLVVDNIEHGTNAIEDWTYPLRADLEERAEEFDGLCTLTSAGPHQRRLTWRAPLA